MRRPMETIRRRVLMLALTFGAVTASGHAAPSVSGSLRISNATGSSCGASASCNALIFMCEPPLMMKDGVDVSIVNVSSFANKLATFALSWNVINPVIGHVRIEFFNFACYLNEGATIATSVSRDLTIPYDAKWMVVTAAWARDVSWTLTLK